MYERILVPTDGDEGMAAAVEEALDLAALTGGILHALYVVDTRDYNTLSDSKWFTIEEALAEEGRRALDAIRGRAESVGVPLETVIERGVPHDEILAYVDAHDIDLVVMGTHGRSGVDRFLLGSVAERVVRAADVPVLVVRIPGETAEGRESTGGPARRERGPTRDR